MSNAITPWTDREMLVYMFTAMEHSNVKPNYNTAPVPAGRTISGCVQKIQGLRKILKKEMDALKSGAAVSTVSEAKGRGKRKADGGEEEKPRKRGRPKKVAEPEEGAEDVKEEV